MKSMHVLIKPASERCNLDCSYCFYHDIANHREVKDYGIMTAETTTNIIEKIFEVEGLRYLTIGFQGGEPLIAGIDYYTRLLSLVEKYNQTNVKVNYSLQTNGTLLDGQYARLFADHNFLIGVSLDGPRQIHDKHRYTYSKGKTYDSVVASLKLLDKYKVDYNVLQVVTNEHTKDVKKQYKYYKQLGISHLQFIPCIDPIGVPNGKVKWSLTSDNYFKYLDQLFKLWYSDYQQGQAFSIQLFDQIINQVNGHNPTSCFQQGRCMMQNIIEADGSVYICDFYVFDQYRVGNLNTDSFNQIHSSPQISQFIAESAIVADKCKQCKYFSLCRNGCKRYRNQTDQINIYCQAFYDFYRKNEKQILSLKVK